MLSITMPMVDRGKHSKVVVGVCIVQKLGLHAMEPLADIDAYKYFATPLDPEEDIARAVFARYLIENAPLYAEIVIQGMYSADIEARKRGQLRAIVKDRAWDIYVMALKPAA